MWIEYWTKCLKKTPEQWTNRTTIEHQRNTNRSLPFTFWSLCFFPHPSLYHCRANFNQNFPSGVDSSSWVSLWSMSGSVCVLACPGIAPQVHVPPPPPDTLADLCVGVSAVRCLLCKPVEQISLPQRSVWPGDWGLWASVKTHGILSAFCWAEEEPVCYFHIRCCGLAAFCHSI